MSPSMWKVTLMGGPLTVAGGRGEGVARAGDGRGDNRAEAHREGAVGAEVPPGADAAVGGVFGDPMTDWGVRGWGFSLSADAEPDEAESAEDGKADEGGTMCGLAAHAASERQGVGNRE